MVLQRRMVSLLEKLDYGRTRNDFSGNYEELSVSTMRLVAERMAQAQPGYAQELARVPPRADPFPEVGWRSWSIDPLGREAHEVVPIDTPDDNNV